MSVFGEILGGVLGLFGSKKKSEKTTTESTVDYQKMASSAAAAGFNPLTAIRNGGSAGFTTSTTTSPTASQLPGALQSIGGALGDALSNQLDPLARKQRQYDTALVDYQLRQLKEGPRAVGTLYSGGTFQGTKVSRTSPSMGGAKKVASYLDEQKPTHTDPWAWTGGLIEGSPDRVDGAAYEDAYGDFVGGAVGGIIPLVHDLWYNAKRGYAWGRSRLPSNDYGALGRWKSAKPRRLVYSDKGPAGR